MADLLQISIGLGQRRRVAHIDHLEQGKWTFVIGKESAKPPRAIRKAVQQIEDGVVGVIAGIVERALHRGRDVELRRPSRVRYDLSYIRQRVPPERRGHLDFGLPWMSNGRAGSRAIGIVRPGWRSGRPRRTVGDDPIVQIVVPLQ